MDFVAAGKIVAAQLFDRRSPCQTWSWTEIENPSFFGSGFPVIFFAANPSIHQALFTKPPYAGLKKFIEAA